MKYGAIMVLGVVAVAGGAVCLFLAALANELEEFCNDTGYWGCGCKYPESRKEQEGYGN